MPVALRLIMTAVLCLFLVLMSAAGFLFGLVSGEIAFVIALGGLTFLLRGRDMLDGILRRARAWREDVHH